MREPLSSRSDQRHIRLLVAGINAARRVQGKAGIVLKRNQAYIGVLIDDLVTKGTTEPYRMFTSRAEYRLLLRQDNADERLSPLGFDLGLLPSDHFGVCAAKYQAVAAELDRLNRIRHEGNTLTQLLRRTEITYATLPGRDQRLSREVAQAVEIAVKYAGYVERQEKDVERFLELESKAIPDWLNFRSIPGLRIEARQKLQTIRPQTLGQASRISGVSPADLSLVMVWIRRGPGNAAGADV